MACIARFTHFCTLVVVLLFCTLSVDAAGAVTSRRILQSSSFSSSNYTTAYVQELTQCTTQLVQLTCTSFDECPDFNPNADVTTQCAIAVAHANATAAAAAAGGGDADADDDSADAADSCSTSLSDDWTYSLHIAAIFVVLIASSLGALLPLAAKYHPGFDLDPYWIVLGKSTGIGIVLACALVHMLQPSNESLTSSCVPSTISEDYEAYAYLFAMLAILAMHAIDFALATYVERRRQEIRAGGRESSPALELVASPSSPSGGGGGSGGSTVGVNKVVEVGAASKDSLNGDSTEKVSSSMLEIQVRPHAGLRALGHHHHHGDGGVVSHVHSILLEDGIERTMSAYMLEFAVTVHSLFIGLANGIDTDSQLHVLLVALVFHQMFEGVALGARIVDANLKSVREELMLIVTFALSAPLGIAIGVGVQSSLNANGETFLLVQGVFDGVCAGILLYIGLMMLLRDFPDDLKRFCAGRPDGVYRTLGMFTALYVGAGFMAYIGKYL